MKSKTVTMVDVAHEVLIRHWTQLRKWVDEDRAAVRQQRNIKEDAKEWEDKGKPVDPGLLLQGAKLATAEDYLEKHGGWESSESLIRKLIQVSQQYRDRLLQEENRRQRELETLKQLAQAKEKARQEAEQRAAEQTKTNKALRRVIYLGLLLAGAVVLAVIAIVFGLEAKRQVTNNELDEEAATVKNLLTTQPVEGLVLAIQATDQSFSELKEVRNRVQNSLLEAVQTDIRERSRLSPGRDAAISPDGKMIVAGNNNGELQLWNPQGQLLGKPFVGHTDNVSSVAFSPDGKSNCQW